MFLDKGAFMLVLQLCCPSLSFGWALGLATPQQNLAGHVGRNSLPVVWFEGGAQTVAQPDWDSVLTSQWSEHTWQVELKVCKSTLHITKTL